MRERLLLDANKWFPICHPKNPPPLYTKTFFRTLREFPQKQPPGQKNIGCGVVGLNEILDTMLAYQLWLPKDFIRNKTASKGSHFED
jgi:hypothetical protein